MAVEASEKPDLLYDLDDDDHMPIILNLYLSSKKNQEHSEVRKITSHSHDGQNSDVPSSNSKSSSMHKVSVLSSAQASPVKSPASVTKPPIPFIDISDDDDDHVPLSVKYSHLGASRGYYDDSVKRPAKRTLGDNNSLHTLVKKSKISSHEDEEDDDDIPISQKISISADKSSSKEKKFKEVELALVEKSIEQCKKRRQVEEQTLHFLKREIEEYSIELENKKKEVGCVQGKLSAYSQQIKMKERDYDAIKRSIEDSNRELEAKGDQLKLVQKQINEFEMQLKIKEKKCDMEFAMVQKVIREHDEDHKKKIQRKIKECEVELKTKEIQLHQFLDNIGKDRERKEEELKAILEKNAEFTKELETKEEELDAKQKLIDQQTKELESEKRKLHEVIAMRNSQCAEVKDFESMKKQLEGQVKELELTKKQFEGRIKELKSNEEQHEDQVKELKSKKKQLEELQVQVKELETIEKQFQQVLDNIDKNRESKEEEFEAAECTMELKTKEEEIDAKQKLIDGQAKELKSERKKLLKVMSIRNSHCAEVKDFESMKKQFEGKIQELELNEKHFVERVKEHESKEKKLEGRVKELESKEKHFEGQVKEFESKERQLEERVKELYSEKEQLEGQVTELRFKDKQLEEKLKELELKEKQIEGQLKDLESKQTQFDGLLKELELKEKQYEALIKLYEEEKVLDDQSSPTINRRSLELFPSEETDEHGLLDNDILVNLQASSDPSKLVLDIIQNPIAPRCSEGDAIIIDSIHIRLLEQLIKISPHVKPHVREEAMKLALHVRANMRPCSENSLALLGLLMLLQIYGLVSSFNEDEVLKLFEVAAQHKQAVELFRTLGFAHKVSDFVQNLIEKQQHLEAVRFICAYKLDGKNHAVDDLLRKHVENAKLISQSKFKESNNMEMKDKARDQEISSLRVVLQCISENKLRYDDLVNDIRDRIIELKKQKANSAGTGSMTILQKCNNLIAEKHAW